jgi:hypothetical protein
MMEEDLLEAAFEKEMYKIYRDAYAKCNYNGEKGDRFIFRAFSGNA